MNVPKRKLAVVVMAAMVVSVAIPFTSGVAQALNGQCTEDGVQGAAFVIGGAAVGGPVGAVGGSVLGAGYFVGSQFVDPCVVDDTSLSNDEVSDLTDNQTFEQVVTVVDTRANEERVIDAVLSTPEFRRNAIWKEAELQAADTYVQNGSESDFINAGTSVIENQTQNDIGNLIAKHYRDIRNARNTYSRLSEINETQLVNVYVNGSEIESSNGISISIPDNSSDLSGHATYTLRDGQQMPVATVTVSNTTYDWRDDLSVTMTDPRSSKEVPIAGQDLGTKYGAEAYTPDISASEADIVINSSTEMGNLGSDTSGQTNLSIYIKSGDYARGSHYSLEGDGHTVYAESGVKVQFDNSYALEVRGGNHTINGGKWENIRVVDRVNQRFNYVTDYKDGLYPVQTSEASNSLLYNNQNVNGDDNVNHRMDSFSKDLINTQKSLRSEMLNEWGDSSSGYAVDVWNKLQADALDITDIVTYSQMFGESFSAEDTDSQAYYDSQYLQAGFTSHDLDSTVVVEVQSGSTVYPQTKLDSPVPLNSSNTYEGHLWTLNPPSSGTWAQNTTYNTTNLGGPLYVTYYDQVESYNDDGSVTIESVPKTVAVEGEFQLNDIINGNGTSVQSIDHGGSPRVDIYNASSYAETVERTSAQNDKVVEDLQNDGGGGAGSGACIVDLPLFGCVQSVYASFGALVLAGIGVYAFSTKGLPNTIASLRGGRQ